MILEELNKNDKIDVILTQPLCIYSKGLTFQSKCWDINLNKWLEADDIDDSYGLDIIETGERIDVYIPRNARCILKKAGADIDCVVAYKNIECDLTFEDEPIDMYFDILDN